MAEEEAAGAAEVPCAFQSRVISLRLAMTLLEQAEGEWGGWLAY